MSEYAVLPLADYVDACEATREMTGGTEKIPSGELAGKIRSINTQEDLSAEMTAQDVLIEDIKEALQGKAAGSGDAPVIRALNITENGTYTAPDGVDGYSPVVVEVPIPDVPNSVAQATPVITVSESGLITAKATQEGGLVSDGTKSATKQLSTKGAATIIPGSAVQTAVSAGTFVTGDIKVAAVEAGGSSVPVGTCTLQFNIDSTAQTFVNTLAYKEYDPETGNTIDRTEYFTYGEEVILKNVVVGNYIYALVSHSGFTDLVVDTDKNVGVHYFDGVSTLVFECLTAGVTTQVTLRESSLD